MSCDNKFFNIVKAYCDVKDYFNIIKTLHQKFTKNNKFTPMTKQDLEDAVECFMEDRKSAIIIFGHMNTWDVSKITDMSCLFQWHTYFNEDISSWDVSNVTNMESMFEGCEVFNYPLNNWNVSKVTNMNSMFKKCETFNMPLDKWNVSQVTDMSNMFYMCRNFNKTINNWKVSSLKEFNCMFPGCKYYETGYNDPKWYTDIVLDKSINTLLKV